jgi:hypothetical protein
VQSGNALTCAIVNPDGTPTQNAAPVTVSVNGQILTCFGAATGSAPAPGTSNSAGTAQPSTNNAAGNAEAGAGVSTDKP